MTFHEFEPSERAAVQLGRRIVRTGGISEGATARGKRNVVTVSQTWNFVDNRRAAGRENAATSTGIINIL